MSFSSEIKLKLCETKTSCPGCCIAEVAGMLRFTGACRENEIRFTTENTNAAHRLQNDLFEAFGMNIVPEKRSKAFIFKIYDKNIIENIRGFVDLDDTMMFSCCRASFIRGAFLGGGSISDPSKSYHLEFDTKDKEEAHRLCRMLAEMKFSAKIAERKGKFIVYIKECENIADMLGYIGAGHSALEMFTIQIEKQMKNEVNRRVNCENANIDKTITASSKQIQAINIIKKSGMWDKLPDVLREIGNLRGEYPEISLKELGELTEPPIGKSGVNHRLNRIIEIAQSIQ